MKRDRLSYTIIFTFFTTFIFSFLLSMAHTSTSERVRLFAIEREQRAVLEALSIEAETQQEVFEKYESIEKEEIGDETIYRYENFIASYFSGPGVWGEIRGVAGFSENIDEIINVVILDQNETPGLGGRVAEEEFLSQLRGEKIGEELSVVRGPGDYDSENSKIDAITGATGTSRSFYSMINKEIDNLRSISERI